MSVICHRLLLTSIFLAGFGTSPQASAAPHPQFARLSLIDGDVRVSRGTRDEPQPGNPKRMSMLWEQAETNLTLEPGFSVAVVTGRAEITLQDGSTMYLGEDSLMSFGKLNSRQYAVDLVSGAFWLNLHPVHDGWYKVTTPTDQMEVKFPDHATMRVNAYLDGMALTAFDRATVHIGKSAIDLAPGEVAVMREGKNFNPAFMQAASPLFTNGDALLQQQIASAAPVLIPAGYTVPDPNQLVPVKNTPRIIPRTIGMASLTDSAMTRLGNTRIVGFDVQAQSFVFTYPQPAGSRLVSSRQLPGNGRELLGGGPSAIRGGKGGAMKRSTIPWDWNNYRTFDGGAVSIP